MAADPQPFRLGVNYLPPGAGMAWLRPYRPVVTRSHFARIAAAGFDSVRVFPPWEDAQPSPDAISGPALDSLVDVADAAVEYGLALIVTLFTGHMSGVNWIPGWATVPAPAGAGGAGSITRDPRFRVVSGARVGGPRVDLRNWYGDPEVVAAQERLAAGTASALAGHRGIWAWDLGNENSNCTVPAERPSALAWLERMTAAIRDGDPGRPVTIGTHMEDLDEDRRLGPAEAARFCDFVCMHGYPIYAPWAAGPADHHLLAFLALVTRWLAGGAGVLFEEFGLPTTPPGTPSAPPLVAEELAAAYTGRALDALRGAGCSGALLWCFSDYEAALYARPPLDLATHERSFGLWRADGSAKPALAAVGSRLSHTVMTAPAVTDWLDIEPQQFNAARHDELVRLYVRYRAAAGADR